MIALLNLQNLLQMHVEALTGLETIFVMMKTTMKNVAMMVETVVETMLTCYGTSTVLYVNVWIQMVNHLQMHVEALTGLETIFVMMKTTMKNVAMMVETVVETM